MVSLHLQHPLTFTAKIAISIGISVAAAAGVAVTAHVTSTAHSGTHAARTAPASHLKATAPARPGNQASPAASAKASPAARTSPQRKNASTVSPAAAVSLGDLTWTDEQGYELPVSATSGPFHASGGLAYGYADTPAGAVLAAAGITARASWEAGPDIFGPTITRQVTGADAMAMLQDDESDYDQDSAQLPGLTLAQFYGYRVDAYTPNGATVSLVEGATGPGGASVYAVTDIEVQWLDGDWRVVAPAGGQWTGSQIPSPAGYAPFPGRPQPVGQ